MLVPVAPIASRVILPDDPGVAFKLATSLLEDDRVMANHHRGLWGYSGTGRDGLGPLTIQSTGVGAASAGLVFGELVGAGMAVAVRVGTARSRPGGPEAGALYAVTHVESDEQIWPLDEPMADALSAIADAAGPVRSIDPHGIVTEHPMDITDLESLVLARAANQHGVRLAAVLAISAAPARRLDHDELGELQSAAGLLAGEALSAC